LLCHVIQDTGYGNQGAGEETPNPVACRRNGSANRDELITWSDCAPIARNDRKVIASPRAIHQTVEETCCFTDDVNYPSRGTILRALQCQRAGIGVAIFESPRRTSCCNGSRPLAFR